MADTQGAKSLQQIAEDQLIGQLSAAVTGYQATGNFSCGGSVPIDARSTTRYGDFTSNKTPITSPPVAVRWDNPKGDLGGKIVFPVPEGKEKTLEKLVQSCQPATFGYDGENVLDEAIRKAGKLDSTEFSTSFNPYDYGIVDAIAQALLPGIARPEELPEGMASPANWGVVAEMYKLNVYSAPSDKFRPHVDTPRGFTQFGSLVVCLPNPHKGGHLRVAHKGVERFYDLGSDSTDLSSMQWAAFYNDCEHEVLPVTVGHRITLTYQLYVSEHLGGAVHPNFPTVDPTLYPLYQSVRDLLESSAFMKKGGYLGFHCEHKYAHTDGTANERLPHALKGLDVVIFTIFRSLGLTVHVRPILDHEFSDGEEDSDGNFIVGESDDEDHVSSADITRAGTKFRKLITNRQETYDLQDFQIAQCWGEVDIFEHVKWLNEDVQSEVGMGFQKWVGNEAQTGWWYTSVAIIVEVPAFQERDLDSGAQKMKTGESES